MRPLLVVFALLGLIGAPGAGPQDAPIRLEKPWVRRAPAMPDARLLEANCRVLGARGADQAEQDKDDEQGPHGLTP